MPSKFYAVVYGDTHYYFRTYEEAKGYALSIFKKYGETNLDAIANDLDIGLVVDDIWIEDCYFNSYKED